MSVTVLNPPITAGALETGAQIAEERSGVDCKINAPLLLGHVKMTFSPARLIVNGGGVVGNVTLNTVPLPIEPPEFIVPYTLFPERSNLGPFGRIPSAFV